MVQGFSLGSCETPTVDKSTDLVISMLSWGAVRPCFTQGTSCVFHKVALFHPPRWNKIHKKFQQSPSVSKKTENAQGYLENSLISLLK